MLKALNQLTGEGVVILSSFWKSQLEGLRLLDEQNALVCPACRQPVRVRAGQMRRWHFAHKHLANCPFERESPLRLEMRAILYEWLVAQWGESSVEVEKPIPNLPRPVDSFIQPSAGVYWIFDTRMPPDEREALLKALKTLNAPIVWLFTAPMLRSEPGQSSQIYLTTTEREFMQQTDGDLAAPGRPLVPGKTLHYLDATAKTLTTFRNLTLLHSPQLFGGRRLASPLSQMLADAETADFLHPGEIEAVLHYRQTRQRREKKIQSTLPQLSIASTRGVLPTDDPIKKSSSARLSPRSGSERVPFNSPFSRTVPCRYCGQLTDDWVRYDGKTQTCVCRACFEGGCL